MVGSRWFIRVVLELRARGVFSGPNLIQILTAKALGGYPDVPMRTRVLATVVLSLTASTPCFAGNTATELVAARELWEQAQNAQARHDWPACEKALIAALPIVATPGIRFHLAYCREMQGKWVEALVDYKLVDEVIAAGTPAPDVESMLEPAIARLEARTPKLTLELAAPPADLELLLDGKRVSQGLLNTRLSLNPGSHSIQVKSSGYAPLARRVTLVESEQRKLPLVLVATAPTATATGHGETIIDAEPDSLKPYLMIAEAALTLGAGSMALYYHLEAGAVDPENEFGGGNARDSAETKALVWGIGSGVGVASFLATWLLWPDQPVSVHATGSGAQVSVRGTY